MQYLDRIGLGTAWTRIKSWVKSYVFQATADRAVRIPYGTTDSTSTSTVFTATVEGIPVYDAGNPTTLADGTHVFIKNTKVTSAAASTDPKCWTLNVNGYGAKKVYVTTAAATYATTQFTVNYKYLFVYDSSLDSNNGGWYICQLFDSNTNTIGYQIRTVSTTRKTTDACRYYKVFFSSVDGTHWVPAAASTSNSATSAKTVNQRPIDPFGPIVYYSTTTSFSAGSNVSASYVWQQYNLTLGYSFNRTGAALTLTTQDPVYIKCAPQADGSAIIDKDNPFVQELPDEEDGKIYIFFGVASAATTVELNLAHPVYYVTGSTENNNRKVRIWTNSARNLHVTLTSSTSNNVTTYTADHTYAEITAALASGGVVDVEYDAYLYTYDGDIDGEIYFHRVSSKSVSNPNSSDNVYDHMLYVEVVNDADVWTFEEPTKLIANASTSRTGVVQLNDAVNSNSTTQAATANAVKKVNDAIPTKTSDLTNDSGYVKHTDETYEGHSGSWSGTATVENIGMHPSSITFTIPNGQGIKATGTNTYPLYIINSSKTKILATSTTNGTVSWANLTGESVTVYVAIDDDDRSSTFDFELFNVGLDSAIEILQEQIGEVKDTADDAVKSVVVTQTASGNDPGTTITIDGGTAHPIVKDNEPGGSSNASVAPSWGAMNTALGNKQNTISDLATIRSGASAGTIAYSKLPLVIEVDDTDTTVPSGTYASITTALSNGRKVFVKVNIDQGEGNVDYYILPLVEKFYIEDDEDSYYFSASEYSATFNATIFNNDDFGYSVMDLAQTSHYHGYIQPNGTLQTNDITIANGDKLVVTDADDSNTIVRASLTFDGSTTTQALSKKGTWETFYQKPSTGIPSSDLASGVQTSLGKADTALQSHQDISGKVDYADGNATYPSTTIGTSATTIDGVSMYVSTTTFSVPNGYSIKIDSQDTTAGYIYKSANSAILAQDPSGDVEWTNTTGVSVTVKIGSATSGENISTEIYQTKGYTRTIEDIQNDITKVTATANSKYTKPWSGIPKSDLVSTVQASLDKADTAIQFSDIRDELDPGGNGEIPDSAAIAAYVQSLGYENVQADWTESDTTSESYIQHKPLVDSSPTYNSLNLVTSGGVYTALDNKYDKSSVYTKTEIESLITGITNGIVIGALPTTGQANKIYRVPGTTSFSDYAWDATNNTWVKLAEYTSSTFVQITEAEYEALSDAEKNNGSWYFIEEE